MKVPKSLSSLQEVLHNKLQIFSLLQPVETKQAVVGQYQAYNAEVREELNKTSKQFSITPTFAGEYSKVALNFPIPSIVERPTLEQENCQICNKQNSQ